MPAQVELLVLLLVIAGGIAYVVVRLRRGALDEHRQAEADPDAGLDPGAGVDPDGEPGEPGE